MKVINKIKITPVKLFKKNVKNKIIIPKTKLKLQKTLQFTTLFNTFNKKVFAEEIKDEPVCYNHPIIKSDVSNIFILYVIIPTIMAKKLNEYSILDLFHILTWFWTIMSLNLIIILILENIH